MNKIRFPKPKLNGEIRIVKNAILQFDGDDWMVISYG